MVQLGGGSLQCVLEIASLTRCLCCSAGYVGVDELTSLFSCSVGQSIPGGVMLWCDALWCIDRTGVVGAVLLLLCKYSGCRLGWVWCHITCVAWFQGFAEWCVFVCLCVANYPCVWLGMCAFAHSCTLLYQALAGSTNAAVRMHILMHAAEACWAHGFVLRCGLQAGCRRAQRDSLLLVHTTPVRPSVCSAVHAYLAMG